MPIPMPAKLHLFLLASHKLIAKDSVIQASTCPKMREVRIGSEIKRADRPNTQPKPRLSSGRLKPAKNTDKRKVANAEKR